VSRSSPSVRCSTASVALHDRRDDHHHLRAPAEAGTGGDMTAGLPAQIGPCQFGIARELDHRALPSRLRSGYAPGGWAVGAGGGWDGRGADDAAEIMAHAHDAPVSALIRLAASRPRSRMAQRRRPTCRHSAQAMVVVPAATEPA